MTSGSFPASPALSKVQRLLACWELLGAVHEGQVGRERELNSSSLTLINHVPKLESTMKGPLPSLPLSFLAVPLRITEKCGSPFF